MTDQEVRKIAIEAAISILHNDPATREFFENEIETDTSLSLDAPKGMGQIIVKIAAAMETTIRNYVNNGTV